MTSTSGRILWTGTSANIDISIHENIAKSVELDENISENVIDISPSSLESTNTNKETEKPLNPHYPIDEIEVQPLVKGIDFSVPRTADEFLQLFKTLSSNNNEGDNTATDTSLAPCVNNDTTTQSNHTKSDERSLQKTVSEILQSSESNPTLLTSPRCIVDDKAYKGSTFGLITSTKKYSTATAAAAAATSGAISSSGFVKEESLPCSPLSAWYLYDGIPNFSKYSSSSVTLRQLQSAERQQLLKDIFGKGAVEATQGKRVLDDRIEPTSSVKRTKTSIGAEATSDPTAAIATAAASGVSDCAGVQFDESTSAAKLLIIAAGEELKRAKDLEKLICESI